MNRRKIAALAVLVAVPVGVLVSTLVSGTHGSTPTHKSRIGTTRGNPFPANGG